MSRVPFVPARSTTQPAVSPGHRDGGARRRSVAATTAGLVCLGAALAGAGGAGSAVAAEVEAAATYPGSPDQSEAAPHTATVDYLVPRLTVDEKLRLVKGGTDPNPHGAAGIILGVPRLGIPDVRHADAQGVNVYRDATAYPGRIGLAASFGRDNFTTFGEAVGKEGRALDIDLLYGPQVDMARMPTWARNMTTDGEDPFLAAELTAREINGIQSQGLLSQVKHFTLYNGQNQNTPSIVPDQAAHQLYFSASEAAVVQAGVTSVMCSYARFQLLETESQPDYACSNSYALNGVLRGQLGFKGWVTSDYGAAKSVSDLLAGTDQEFATNFFAPAVLKPLVDPASPTFDQAYADALDESVARILYQYERFGLLDDSSYPEAAKTPVEPLGPAPALDKQKGIVTSRRLAEQTGVLLKNDGAELPLSRRQGNRIVAIGPTANLLPAAPGGERARGFGDRNNITAYDALTQQNGDAGVSYVPGIDRIGTVVPASALRTANDPAAPAGLTRTETDANGTVLGTTVVTTLGGQQTDLVRGNTYTYDGYLNVTAADTYQLWLARPVGTFSGDATQYNRGINPGLQQGPNTGASANVALAVDGVTQTLTNNSTILPNSYPDGPTVNGQYLGLDNSGVAAALSPGLHQVRLTYRPQANLAPAPTFRFSWAGQQADLDAAVAAARNANQAVVFVDDANTTTTPGNVGTLGPNQDRLVQAVADANPNTTVVLNTNGAVQMPWLGSVRAVLEMWYPGQEGGTATANLLYGNTSPSGHLPITFPASSAATPFGGHPERSTGVNGQITWSEGLDMGYRWYVDHDVRALFPFGHGLSYTRFAYSGLSVSRTADAGLDVTVTVTNTGGSEGTAVPQVYVGPSPSLPARIQQTGRQLAEFGRVDLDAGASATVTMHVDPRELSSWDTRNQSWVLGTGSRTVYVGSSSEALPLEAQVTVRATEPALSAPKLTLAGDAVQRGTTTFTAGSAELAWSAAEPASSLGGYEVLVDGDTVASVDAGTTSATVALADGAHSLAVRAQPSSEAVAGGAVTSEPVQVAADLTGPRVAVAAPALPTVRGTATDRNGSGVASVTVKATERRSGAWWFYSGTAWRRATSQADATARARALTATRSGNRWSVPVRGVRPGTLRVLVRATDAVGNAGTAARSSRVG